ncbi:MAG: hypothetical protein GY870_07100 [archaeon]|nr:hypothetical protein [archaeon]
MGLGKSFGISLLVYLVLNFAIAILAAVLGGGDISLIFAGFSTDLIGSLNNLLFSNSVVLSQGAVYDSILLFFTGNMMDAVAALLLALVPSLVAAMIAGKMAEGAGQAFGGWMLTAVLCSILYAVLGIVGGVPFNLMILLAFLLIGALNGLMWSGIACLMGKED